MRGLLEIALRLLNDNPWLWLVVIAWVGGMISNVARGKQRKEREAQRREQQRIGRTGDEVDGARPRERPEQPERAEVRIAREMRRILGVEEPTAPPPPPLPSQAPPPPTMRPRRVVLAPERPPAPVVPTVGARHLPLHADSHVGDTLGRRAIVGSGRVGEHAAGKELGNLGGRAPARGHTRSLGNRYVLDDLKRILVLNEILGPPLALRSERRD